MIATILMVAIAVVLASMLYVMVDGTMVMSNGSHSCVGPQVRVHATDAEWFVEILTVAPGTRPSRMFLEVRTSDGIVSLAKTSLSGLTPESGAAYRDANPQVDEVRPSDGIVLEAARFPTGSMLAISDGSGMLTVRALQ